MAFPRLRFLALLALLVFPVCAQQAVDVPVQLVRLSAHSGTRTARADGAVTWSQTLRVPGTSSIQVCLASAALASDDDKIIITSFEDGEHQVLDRLRLQQWGCRSAWFNGDQVLVELYIAAGSQGHVRIDEVVAGGLSGSRDGSCPGNDFRDHTNDTRVCRLISSAGICTGFLIDDSSTILSAGHCLGSSLPMMVAQFRVPPSSSSGVIRHPAVRDQFPVDLSSIEYEDNGPGNDWLVARLFSNSLGERVGSYRFDLVTQHRSGFITYLYGFGTDQTPPERNYVEQRSWGTSQVSGDLIVVDAYTEPGADGGPIVSGYDGEQVEGILTHCASSSSAQWQGTSVLASDLQEAISRVAGCRLVSFSQGGSATITCSPTVFNVDTTVSHWMAVGIVSSSDWDLDIGGTASTLLGGGQCDFLISNGHASGPATHAPDGGVFALPPTLLHGSDPARAQFQHAIELTLDSPRQVTWESGDVLKIFEFNINAPGSFDLHIQGHNDLEWVLYRPTNDGSWRHRGTGELFLAEGSVGAPANVQLGTGWHALVVLKDGLLDGPFSLTAGICQTLTPRCLNDHRKVMITEVSWGAPDGVEVTNFDVVPVSLDGWRVHWDGGVGLKISETLSGVTLAPGEIILFVENATRPPETPPGIRVFWMPDISTSYQNFSVGLVNAAGVTVDEVRVKGDYISVILQPGQPLPIQPTLGGEFRGRARRPLNAPTWGAVGVERIWGLDSDSGKDWTGQLDRSFGLQNRNSGYRGTDPQTFLKVVINEICDNPDYIELRNVAPVAVDLQGWFLYCSGRQNQDHRIIRPFATSLVIAPGEFVVIGDGPTPPSELPSNVPYIALNTVAGGNIPYTHHEFDCALYDNLGRLSDLVRTTGDDDNVVHNLPRAPAYWRDFTGAAGRSTFWSRTIGRDPSSTDGGTGADWGPVTIRTMGSPNSNFGGPTGLGDLLDVRLSDVAGGGGLTVIVNGGHWLSGAWYSVFSSYGSHLQGQGPVHGMSPIALTNWANLNQIEPWGAALDGNGSYRFDLPAGTLSPFAADHIAIVQSPTTGQVWRRTAILEEDH